MTTEELEKKLKISKNTCIHCPTSALAKQVLNIFHHLGLKWCNEKHYIICTNWVNYKENTTYHPFDGKFSSLEFYALTGYNIINAEEFITLHTEGAEFITLHTEDEESNLESYIPDNPQEFIVGDEVIDIITRQKGKIHEINTNDGSPCPICVSTKSYTLDGKYYVNDKYPRLLHYRDDYDYSIIDFNNLPKRQEPKRWRAEKGGEYHYIRFYLGGLFSICATKDDNSFMDNMNYNSGNYFRTEVVAQEVADKLNKYFQELINHQSQLKIFQ